MSFWKSIGDFFSNPIVRGVSAVTGAAGAAGAFDGLEYGDTINKIAGGFNMASGAASALDGKQSGLSRALGGLQFGLGGFNVLQGGVDLPFGGGKVGGFGSVSSWLTPDAGTESASVSGGGWSVAPDEDKGRLIFSEPLAAPPGMRSEMPTNATSEVFGIGGAPRVDTPNQFAMAAPTQAAAAAPAALPAPPEMAPRPTFFGNGQLTDFETMTGGRVTGQTTGSLPTPDAPMPPPPAPAVAPTMSAASAPAATPPAAAPNANVLTASDRIIGQTADGVRVLRGDGSIQIIKDTAKAVPFFERIANAAAADPMKAMSAVAMVGGLVGQLFQPSITDIYKEMAAKYDPDSANAQQFMADFKARAKREAEKQHAQLTEQLRGTMADRGMADSTVHYAAKAELDKGLTETIANLDWNAWQAWNQYARSMGATQVQSAQSAALLAGNPTSFANVSRILAKTA